MIKKCKYCGEEFEYEGNDNRRKYCKYEHQMKHYKKTYKEKMEALKTKQILFKRIIKCSLCGKDKDEVHLNYFKDNNPLSEAVYHIWCDECLENINKLKKG